VGRLHVGDSSWDGNIKMDLWENLQILETVGTEMYGFK
jgi:hypothetical protein